MAACKEQVSVSEYMSKLGAEAASAARVIANANTAAKNAALRNMAERIISQSDFLAKENAKDLIAGKDKGLSDALLDRLELTSSRIEGMAEGLSQIAALPDPIGQIDNMAARESGIQVGKMRVPLGVIGIIYESRPNVTADAAGLCLKSGNATILRGGSEAIHSNRAIGVCVQQGLESAGLPKSVVQIVETTDREAVGLLLGMSEQVDMIIPRGGKSLIERVARDSRIPVLKHLDGVCHVYIDVHANPEQAVAIAVNAKTHRYGVCNAMETLLIHSQLAQQLLPIIEQRYAEHGVELRGCERTCAILPQIKTASEQDWYEEYLAPILAIRVVDDLDQAIHHIEKYGSHHTDAIVSEDYTSAQRFLKEVDSSSVMVNASTRFADGFEYGLGAEIGISTDKLHARGPVGLEGLTTQKYIVLGEGNLRE